MEEQKTFSKSTIARIFGVNRTTVYSWENAGCPMMAPAQPGGPAELDFEAVLEWRLCQMEIYGASEAGLEIVEGVVRLRLRKFLDSRKGQACSEKEVQTSAEQI